MALPSNTVPVYTLTIPSTQKKLKYRPFLVKDEKALLIAQQSEDTDIIVDTIKEVIRSCASTPVDVDKLAIFDIEYIFLQIRAKSVGEFIDLKFQCDNDHGEQNPEATSIVRVDLTKAEVEIKKDHTNKVHLFNDVGIVLKYPTLSTLKKVEKFDTSNPDLVFEVLLDSIDYIYDGDQIFHAAEQTQKELEEFINNLTPQQFEKIQIFFETIPTLRIWVDYECGVCGKKHRKYLQGIQSFF